MGQTIPTLSPRLETTSQEPWGVSRPGPLVQACPARLCRFVRFQELDPGRNVRGCLALARLQLTTSCVLGSGIARPCFAKDREARY